MTAGATAFAERWGIDRAAVGSFSGATSRLCPAVWILLRASELFQSPIHPRRTARKPHATPLGLGWGTLPCPQTC